MHVQEKRAWAYMLLFMAIIIPLCLLLPKEGFSSSKVILLTVALYFLLPAHLIIGAREVFSGKLVLDERDRQINHMALFWGLASFYVMALGLVYVAFQLNRDSWADGLTITITMPKMLPMLALGLMIAVQYAVSSTIIIIMYRRSGNARAE
jgi:hypothetical protein